jgi:hypothetical protein
MSNRSLSRLAVAALITLAIPVAMFAGPSKSAPPTSGSVTYSGQGLTENQDTDGSYYLNNELCGLANGADAEGPYILWVLTASGSSNATITGPWGTGSMQKIGNGTFKYVSGWYDPSSLPGNVSASYDKGKNPQLVVSHGCRPKGNGTWCSPGFWKNAQQGAWNLVLPTYSQTSLFNSTVVAQWYGATFANDPTIFTVMSTPKDYNGTKVSGLDSRSVGLATTEAVAAMLTDAIPGYTFDPSKMGLSDHCAIDHFGNFKN